MHRSWAGFDIALSAARGACASGLDGASVGGAGAGASAASMPEPRAHSWPRMRVASTNCCGSDERRRHTKPTFHFSTSGSNGTARGPEGPAGGEDAPNVKGVGELMGGVGDSEAALAANGLGTAAGALGGVEAPNAKPEAGGVAAGTCAGASSGDCLIWNGAEGEAAGSDPKRPPAAVAGAALLAGVVAGAAPNMPTGAGGATAPKTLLNVAGAGAGASKNEVLGEASPPAPPGFLLQDTRVWAQQSGMSARAVVAHAWP